MLRSMTGFGRCYVENDIMTQQWEIKSVNSRYLDIKWHLRAYVRYLEPAFEKILRKYAGRGRVEIFLNLKFDSRTAPKPFFDNQQANAMLNSLKALAQEHGGQFTFDFSRFLMLPSLWHEAELEEMDGLSGLLEEGFIMTLEDWNEARDMEGSHLEADLEGRIARMTEWTAIIGQSAPAIKEDRIQLLRERLASVLAENDFDLEENRFLQEIVILCDRLDVSEEITRLGAHMERLQQLLHEGPEVGRKLDFTLQECFREINTCGNKLQDAELSRIIVEYKNELEKCREQVQNLE